MQEFRPAHVVQQDAELAVRFTSGDPEAIRELVGRYAGRVHAVASTDNELASADNVSRHTFLQAWRNADDFEPGRDFDSWLASLTRLAGGRELSGAEVESIWVARAAVEALGDDEAAVARLEHVDRLTVHQIAERLGVDDGIVMTRSASAARRLRNRWESVFGAQGGDLDASLGNPSVWTDTPAHLADRVVDAIRSESIVGAAEPVPAVTRRGRSWLRPAALGAGAMVLFLFGGIILLSGLSGSDRSITVRSELTSTGLLADVVGRVDDAVVDTGVRFELETEGLPKLESGSYYQASIVTTDGQTLPVGTFIDSGKVTLSAGIERAELEQFIVTVEQAVGADDPGQAVSDDVVLRTTFTR